MLRRIPIALALFSIFGGTLISIFFGLNEEFFKSRIDTGLKDNIKIQQITDPVQKEEKMKSETEKNWRYYQRFHFHATGIGAMMLGVLLFLSRLAAPKKLKLLASYLVSVGGTLYPFVWLFAAMYGPSMGRAEAKEHFAIFGYMGGVFLIGALATLVASLKYDLADSVHTP